MTTYLTAAYETLECLLLAAVLPAFGYLLYVCLPRFVAP